MPRIQGSDIGIQTECFPRYDQDCQTDILERKDFQAQATIEIETESMTTQTENSGEHEFQVQAVLGGERASVAIQTITDYIPNSPNSVEQTETKKRKLSKHQKSYLLSPTSPATSNTTETTHSDTQSNIDDSISKSEVYKIYRRNKDPKDAMKQIKKLKNCISFEEPRWTFPNETDFEITCKKALRTLLSFGTSKFETIKRFLEEGSYYEETFQTMVPICIPEIAQFATDLDKIMDNCFTRIKILLPFGFEFWYVKKFEGRRWGIKMVPWSFGNYLG